MPLPQPPTLLTPINGQLVDSTLQLTFTWTYNNADPAQDQTAFSFRRFNQELFDYEYWNGTAWILTTPQWIAQSAKSYTFLLAAWEMFWGGYNNFDQNNSQFDSSIGTWTGLTNTTLARDTVTVFQGSGSLKMTSIAAGTMVAGSGASGVSNYYNYTTGNRVDARIMARASAATAGRAAFIRIAWYTAAGVFVNNTDGQAFTISNDKWYSIEGYGFVGPATAARYLVELVITGPTAAAEIYYLDAAMHPFAGYSLPGLNETFQYSIATQNSSGQGAYANDQLVTLAYPNAVTVTAPTASPTMSRPVVRWSTSNQSGFAQDAYQVKIFDAATYGGGGFDPSVTTPTWDSGIITSPDTSVRVGINLVNGTTYRAYVRTRGGGNVSALWTAWGFSQFTETLTVPATPGLTVTAQPTQGNFSVAVTNAGSVKYVIERSSDGGTTWEEVRLATRANPAPQGGAATTSTTVVDDEAPLRVLVTYRVYAVTGTPLDLTYSTVQTAAAVRCNTTAWWLRDPLTPASRVSFIQQSGDVTIIGTDGEAFTPEGRTKPVVLFSRAPIGAKFTIEAMTLNQATHDAVYNLLVARKTLCVQDVHGKRYYCRPVSEVKRTQVQAIPLAVESYPVRYSYMLSCELVECDAP